LRVISPKIMCFFYSDVISYIICIMSRKLAVKCIDQNDVKGFNELVDNGFKVPRRLTDPRDSKLLKRITSENCYSGTYLHFCLQNITKHKNNYPMKTKLSPRMVKYLMRLGVDERLPDSDGLTPLDVLHKPHSDSVLIQMIHLLIPNQRMKTALAG